MQSSLDKTMKADFLNVGRVWSSLSSVMPCLLTVNRSVNSVILSANCHCEVCIVVQDHLVYSRWVFHIFQPQWLARQDVWPGEVSAGAAGSVQLERNSDGHKQTQTGTSRRPGKLQCIYFILTRWGLTVKINWTAEWNLELYSSFMLFTDTPNSGNIARRLMRVWVGMNDSGSLNMTHDPWVLWQLYLFKGVTPCQNQPRVASIPQSQRCSDWGGYLHPKYQHIYIIYKIYNIYYI